MAAIFLLPKTWSRVHAHETRGGNCRNGARISLSCVAVHSCLFVILSTFH